MFTGYDVGIARGDSSGVDVFGVGSWDDIREIDR